MFVPGRDYRGGMPDSSNPYPEATATIVAAYLSTVPKGAPPTPDDVAKLIELVMTTLMKTTRANRGG